MALALFSNIGDVNSNALPADTAALPGGGLSNGVNVKESGNYWNQTPAGGLAPAGTAAGYIVALATLPANAFNAAGRNLTVTAQGNFAANANTKTISIVVNPTAPAVGSVVSGGTTIADTGNYSTTGAVGWSLAADVFKYGAAGSNTQIGIHLGAQIGSTVGALVSPIALTSVESGIIYVALTANATTATTDISVNFFFTNGVN